MKNELSKIIKNSLFYGDTLMLLNGTYSFSCLYYFPGEIIVADNAITEITTTVEKDCIFQIFGYSFKIKGPMIYQEILIMELKLILLK